MARFLGAVFLMSVTVLGGLIYLLNKFNSPYDL